MKARPHPVMALSFVRPREPADKDKSPRDFWSVAATGDYDADYAVGEAAGQEALAYIRSNRSPYILGWVVRDMVEKGRFGGVEVGFMGVFSLAAMGCGGAA